MYRTDVSGIRIGCAWDRVVVVRHKCHVITLRYLRGLVNTADSRSLVHVYGIE